MIRNSNIIFWTLCALAKNIAFLCTHFSKQLKSQLLVCFSGLCKNVCAKNVLTDNVCILLLSCNARKSTTTKLTAMSRHKRCLIVFNSAFYHVRAYIQPAVLYELATRITTYWPKMYYSIMQFDWRNITIARRNVFEIGSKELSSYLKTEDRPSDYDLIN